MGKMLGHTGQLRGHADQMRSYRSDDISYRSYYRSHRANEGHIDQMVDQKFILEVIQVR